MRLLKYTSTSGAQPNTPYLLLITALAVAWLGLAVPADGQSETRRGSTKGVNDIVFALCFSPDGRTLAIARGDSEPVQRFGRIELWNADTLELRHVIKGFDGPVRSISFSPDGHTLISSSTEFRSPRLRQEALSRDGSSVGELKWWDTRTGELKQKQVISRESVQSIRAIQSPDGTQLAIAETVWQPFHIFTVPTVGRADPNLYLMDRRLSYFPEWSFKVNMKLVDAQTGELRFKLGMHQSGPTSFSPDGHLLAVANGKEVKLWNSQTGKEVRKLKSLRGSANAVAFSRDGRLLAVASTRYERENAEDVIKIIGFSEVKLFDVSSGKLMLTIKDVGAVNTLAFNQNGRILIVGGVLSEEKGEIAGMKFFDLQTGNVSELRTGVGYKEAVDSLVLNHHGELLAFRSGPATVKLLDTRTGTVKQTWDADSVGDAVERPTSRFLLSVSRVLAVAFSADGTTVVGESDRGEIKSWDYRTGEIKRQLNLEQNEALLVAASTDGASFAEVSQGKLFVWDANSVAKRMVPLPDLSAVSALAVSATGQLLAVGSGNEVTLLSGTGQVFKKLTGREGSVSSLAFSYDGRTVAATDENGSITIWDVSSGSIERALMGLNEITVLVFSPNGQTLATAAADNTISLWNLRTGVLQGKFQKHDATINALAFSPDGQFLASGGDDRKIVLWEVATGKSKRTFKGHEQTVASLAFSPDGQLLASGSGNASVVLWEVGSGKLNRVLR